MSKRIKRLVAVAMGALVALPLVLAGPASADSTALSIGRNAFRSPSHLRVFVRVRVVCSPDTNSMTLYGHVEQVRASGTVQEADAELDAEGAFECNGEEEVVLLPFRRPPGGFSWRTGALAVQDITFETEDVSGDEFSDSLPNRMVNVRR